MPDEDVAARAVEGDGHEVHAHDEQGQRDGPAPPAGDDPHQHQRRPHPDQLGGEAPQVVREHDQQVGRAFDPGPSPEVTARDHVAECRERLGVPPVEPRIHARPDRQVDVRQEPGDEAARAGQDQPRTSRQRGLGQDGEEPDGDRHQGHERVVGRAEPAEERGNDQIPVATRRVPRERGGGRQHHEQRVQRVDALDVGLAPEARADREQQGRGGGGHAVQSQAKAEAMEERHRRRGAGRAEEAHPERDRAQRHEQGPELPQQHVERIPAGMRNAQGVDGRHQLAAVPDVDRAAGADRVEGKDADAEGGGLEIRAAEP